MGESVCMRETEWCYVPQLIYLYGRYNPSPTSMVSRHPNPHPHPNPNTNPTPTNRLYWGFQPLFGAPGFFFRLSGARKCDFTRFRRWRCAKSTLLVKCVQCSTVFRGAVIAAVPRGRGTFAGTLLQANSGGLLFDDMLAGSIAASEQRRAGGVLHFCRKEGGGV